MARVTSPIIRTNCPVCNSTSIHYFISAKDYTVSNRLFDIYQCHDCKLRFTQSIPDESEIGQYYKSESYISHSNTKKGLISSLYQWVRKYSLRQKRNLIHKLTQNQKGKLLDIGCGTGEFLHTMQQAGWQTQGLEPDDSARKQAQSNYGLEVKEPSALYDLEAAQYDVISMWHVLEHVHKLHESLDQIHSILNEKGKLLIAVPNYASLDAQFYQAYWAAYDVPRHLYHFHPDTMTQLMKAHGFKIKELKSMPFDSFYVSLLSERYQHSKLRLFPAFFMGLRSYFKAKNEKERASSILYIVEKGA